MMKTATLKSLPVELELTTAAPQRLQEGETVSGFVAQAIREDIAHLGHQREFIARGLASRDNAKRTGNYVAADTVMGRLKEMLATVKASARTTITRPNAPKC
jgi:hypothetical protein